MHALLALALTLSAPAAGEPKEDGKPSLLVLSLEPTGVTEDEAKILDGMIANALTRHESVQVVTADELQQMMELEGEKQAMGCDTTSCLGEIAGAMGARFVLFGKAGVFGELFVVQLNLYDSEAARAVTREEIKADSLDVVAERVQPAVDALVSHITGEPAVPVAESGVSPLLLVGAGVGAAGVLAAAGTGVGLAIFLSQLGDPDSLSDEKTTAADFAPWMVAGTVTGGAIALLGAGVAVAGLVME
jgi:hypothetical protein